MPIRSPSAHDPGAPKIAAACQKPRLKVPALHVRRRMHHGSEARAAVSVAGCGSTGAVPCDRPRRFLRPGLGRVSLKRFARQASRFGYHGTRTVGIRFRRRGKAPSWVLISAAGAHTEASEFLRRRGQGSTATAVQLTPPPTKAISARRANPIWLS
jgi:hypothetical protein